MKTATRLSAVAVLAMAAVLIFSPAVSAVDHEVEIEDFAFVPQKTVVNIGDTVTWRNRDAIGHTSTSDNGVWNSGTLLRDQRFSFIFTVPGVYPYHCTPHPFMRDTIFVNPLSGIGENDLSKPTEFELSQNYPNPFNARTIIRYAMSEPAHASVEVYNVLGQKVASLLDGNMNAGDHEITWDATGVTSGVFFYRVSVGNTTKTGRMVLLK